MRQLHGRNAILTGASYGIGPFIARALAARGVNLALAARSAERLDAVAAVLSAAGVHAVPIATDVRDAAAREALVSRATAELGPIDILVNNASAAYGGRLHTSSPEQIDEILETDLTAGIQLTRRVLPDMLARRRGHIVHVASLAGKIPLGYIALYAAAKHGVVGFSHSLQEELSGTGVHTSVVCSGFVRSEGMWSRFEQKVHPAFGLATPEGVAAGVVRAIRRERAEVIVNPMPVRPVIALWALWPAAGLRVFRLLRVNRFLSRAGAKLETDPGLPFRGQVEQPAAGR